MIRPFNHNDLENYIRYSKRFYSSSAVDHSIDEENFITTFNECLNNSPFTHGIMVEWNNHVVGYGLISITFSNEAGGLVVLLEELYIEEEFRSKGLGKEFFNYIYEKYPNAKRYRLEVTNTNTRAINLYEKLGYEKLDYLQMIKDM